ncbi:MAG: helix-turn-helix domain-containing protein [Polaromonas sp.]|uniref:HVO_A0114 family putative DNA-binding protein n=1 Tax=Polaromonas sp. TaxID=1869339 RepID=UPI002489B786|nr:MarR family transcriptional regulator [Polaromonas sp.]MDI1238497.1 helix-turn-helix domain-containing protein [Polaromonas sp.]MDI1341602.1 helix-turn-helix domain-containing protein [Polaromonas sp.]
MTSIATFLLGQNRSAVLSALLLHPEASLHVRELARLTGTSPGSLHRDLRALAELGLLHRKEVGRQVHYQANKESPVFTELAGLLRKTAGLVDVLRAALSPIRDEVEFAFVYGSMASGEEHAYSDVDVMIVGAVGFGRAVQALVPVQEQLRREVNPAVFSLSEFKLKLKDPGGFVAQVWRGPKLWLIGDDLTMSEVS